MHNNSKIVPINIKYGLLKASKGNFMSLFKFIFDETVDDIGLSDVLNSLRYKILYENHIGIGSVNSFWHEIDLRVTICIFIIYN